MRAPLALVLGLSLLAGCAGERKEHKEDPNWRYGSLPEDKPLDTRVPEWEAGPPGSDLIDDAWDGPAAAKAATTADVKPEPKVEEASAEAQPEPKAEEAPVEAVPEPKAEEPPAADEPTPKAAEGPAD